MVAGELDPAQDYSVFGLRVRSSFPLPELPPAPAGGAPDVTITLGAVPEAKDHESGLTSIDGALLLIIRDVGCYRIESGSRIVLQPQPGAPERNVRLFLLGSAFGVLLHQRGLLPLHANAVSIGGSAVAFMGESGAGKSTLAAWFHDHGYPILADDVCVVGFNGSGEAVALPGLQRLRLWREALDFTGREADLLQRSYVGDLGVQVDKFDVPIDSKVAASDGLRLSAIYLLARADSFSIEPLHGVDAAEAVFANTYRGAFVSAANNAVLHWQSATALVTRTPVYSASRVWDLTKLDEQCLRLIEHATSAAAAGGD